MRKHFWFLTWICFLIIGCGEESAPLSKDGGTVKPDAALDSDLNNDLDSNSETEVPVDLETQPGAFRAIFKLPETTTGLSDFFNHPWPSDLRRTEDGFVDVTAFPNPQNSTLLTRYLQEMSREVDGYSTHTTVYFRFSDPVDVSSFPQDPSESLIENASVFLINVDRESSAFGQRHPVVVGFESEKSAYWPANTLFLRPVYGIPLRPQTTYAAVVTRDLHAVSGESFQLSSQFESVLAGLGDASIQEIYAPALTALTDAEVDTDILLSMSVFTTQDPTKNLLSLHDWVMESYPEPSAVNREWRWRGEDNGFIEVDGRYGPSPMFMQGEVPFAFEGGSIEFQNDEPMVAEHLELRFKLTLPKTPMPEAGYPLVIFAHGTGDDWLGAMRDIGLDMANVGFATMATDQIHHGERNPSEQDPERLIFNAFNPLSLRNNALQSAIDLVQQARFAHAVEIPSNIIRNGGHFDPEKIYFYGHSQGGINGPLFLAIDHQTQGGVLSAAGAVIQFALTEKTEPVNIPALLEVALGITSGRLRYEHPALTLLQTWVEPSDSSNYVQMLFEEPRPGFAPKHIFQIEGITDAFTPPGSSEALATAAGLPILGEEHRSILGHALRGIEMQSLPARLNVANGQATAGLVQYPGGHFVAFEDEDAIAHIRHFFQTAASGVPEIGRAEH
jgi:predicted esterase